MEKNVLIIITLFLSFISGCSLVRQGNYTQNTSVESVVTTTTSNISEVLATSTIDKNDVSTWPRFEFKELGFSVQLPFEKSDVETEYRECKNENYLVKKNGLLQSVTNDGEMCLKKENYSFFYASSIVGNYSFLSAEIGYGAINGEGGVLKDEKGDVMYKQIGLPVKKKGHRYVVNLTNEPGEQTIKPLQTKIIQGVEMIKFNELDEITRHHHYVDYTPEEMLRVPYITVIFNLPRDVKSIFKVISFSFVEKDLSNKKLFDMLKTIEFIK